MNEQKCHVPFCRCIAALSLLLMIIFFFIGVLVGKNIRQAPFQQSIIAEKNYGF